MGKCRVLTVDGERGRCLRLADHVLRHAGVGTNVGRDEPAYLQGVVFTDLVSGQREGDKPQTNIQEYQSQPMMWTQSRKGIQRAPSQEAYLPLGRSPSSFLQRTVGTGSPRASHLNSTLWSTNTT